MTTATRGSWGNEFDGIESAYERVLAAVEQAGLKRENHAGYVKVSCPLHKDTHPSLSIMRPDRNRDAVGLKCHAANCDPHDIVDALGLRYDQLWDRQARPCTRCGKATIPNSLGDYLHDQCAPGARRTRPRRAKPARAPRPGRLPARITVDDPGPEFTVVTRRHDTVSEAHMNLDGEVVAESVRWEEVRHYAGEPGPRTEKGFRQRYTDGHGGWVWSKIKAPADLVVPLWRLPEVSVAIVGGQTVWLAEGHKDARSLLSAGAGEATTNIDGALHFGVAEAEQLRGAHVIVVCDRDHAGYTRGVKVGQLLQGVAASVRVVLPKIDTAKADATDHLAAGHTLADFVPVGSDQLQALQLCAQIIARIGLCDPDVVAREIRAQLDLADALVEQAPATAHDHRARAQRWALELGRSLIKVDQDCRRLDGLNSRTDQQLITAGEVGQIFAAATQAAYLTCGTAPADDVDQALHAHLPVDQTGEAVDGGEVLRPRPPQWSRVPRVPFPMSRGRFRYDTGDEGVERGVFMQASATDDRLDEWDLIGPLPHVHARVVRRDGSGTRTGLDYLISADPQSRPMVIDPVQVRDGSWAPAVGLDLSADPKIVQAVATAIVYYAGQAAPERESTPAVDRATGQLELPPTGLLPEVYFATSACSRQQAITIWHDLLVEAATAPKVALLLGASAVAPFLHALGRDTDLEIQSHIVALSGEKLRGKTITLKLAAGIWGESVVDAELCQSWNTSPQGVTEELGRLRTLPAFRDEAHMTGWTSAQWGRQIYAITQGAGRVRPDRLHGSRKSPPWHGILFSSGNNSLTQDLGAGGTQGVLRRVVEIRTPLTTSAEQTRKFTAGLRAAYGHLGVMIAEQVRLPDVADRVRAAEQLLTIPDGDAIELAMHLRLHVAGAMILDELAGTGKTLTLAAARQAQEYLDQWRPAPEEADRVLEAIADWIAREPTRWPTQTEMAAGLQPMATADTAAIPYAGVARNYAGIRADDDTWVALFPSSWKEMVEADDITNNLALEQLAERNILHRTWGSKTHNEWQTVITVRENGGKRRSHRVYKLRWSPNDITPNDTAADDDPYAQTRTGGAQTSDIADDYLVDPAPSQPQNRDDNRPDSAAVTDPGEAVTGGVTGGVTGTYSRLTRGVTGVTGQVDPISRVSARESTSSLSNVSTAGRTDPHVDAAGGGDTPPEANTGPDAEEWAQLPEHQPCTVCAEPASHARNGRPVHAGECADQAPAPPVPPPTGLPAAAGAGVPPRTVLVHAEGHVALDPERPTGTYTDRDGHPHRRDWATIAGPCESCGGPCKYVIEGHRIHPLCWEHQHTDRTVGPAPEAPVQVESLPQRTAGTKTEQPTPATPPDRSTGAPAADRSAARSGRRRAARFVGPAAILTADALHLPGGVQQPWSASHLGDLALLTSETQGLRIGFGGGEDRLPDAGQLWLTDTALVRLGFPTRLEWPTARMDQQDWADRGQRELFAPFDQHPMVTAALQAGWVISTAGGHLREWTRLTHPDLLRRGAQLVFLGWQKTPPPALLDDDPAPGELADRLATVAAALTVPYTANPAVTGLRLIEHTRPPRRSADDPVGQQRNRVAVVLNEPAELPPFLRDRDDPRFTALEADWCWWRLWTPEKRSSHHALTDSERAATYVHGYDRGASHLAPWQRLDLGVEGLIHRSGPDAVWDGKEKPGYYLVDPWEWTEWALPDPADGARTRVENGLRWVTSHTLRQLAAHGIEPVVHESYRWSTSVSYLETAAKVLRAARDHEDPMVRTIAKTVYTKTTGKLAERHPRGNLHLNRPDWYHHIVAASRTAILHQLTKNLTNGAAPIVVDHDAIFYTSNEPDPIKAWPGEPAKLGTRPGDWKPLGTARLAGWGPQHLIDATPMTGHKGFRSWRYDNARRDLTPPGQPLPSPQGPDEDAVDLGVASNVSGGQT